MNTIQTVLGLAKGQKVMTFGPFEIVKDYGLNQSAKATWRAMLISDTTGKTILKIWGASANLPIQEGQTVSLKADPNGKGISMNEYNGKITISADKVTLDGVEGGAVPQGNAATGSGGCGANKDKSMKELLDYALACVDYAREQKEDSEDVLASVFGAACYGFKEGRKLGFGSGDSSEEAAPEVVNEESEDGPF
jgi:hypothetical protein